MRGTDRTQMGRPAGATGRLIWEKGTVREGRGTVTENERRAADSLRLSDVVLRGLFAIALILVAFAALMAIQPA